jgi:hypothetical protein
VAVEKKTPNATIHPKFFFVYCPTATQSCTISRSTLDLHGQAWIELVPFYVLSWPLSVRAGPRMSDPLKRHLSPFQWRPNPSTIVDASSPFPLLSGRWPPTLSTPVAHLVPFLLRSSAGLAFAMASKSLEYRERSSYRSSMCCSSSVTPLLVHWP